MGGNKNELGDAVLLDVAVHMQLRQVERNEIMIWDGEPCVGLHIIRQSSVKLYRLSPQG